MTQKIVIYILALLFLASSIRANELILKDQHSSSNIERYSARNAPGFKENKGQLVDMDGKPVPNVLFKTEAPGLDMYITKQGITYLFSVFHQEEVGPGRTTDQDPKRWITWDRIDMVLKGATIDPHNINREKKKPGFSQYFLPHCPDGITDVHTYEKITIQEVYPGIDWVLYNPGKKGFKYDFIIHPGADPNQIKLMYNSQNPLTLNTDGTFQIKTASGTLAESSPFSYIDESGEQVGTTYEIESIKNLDGHFQTCVGFDVDQFDNQGKSTLIIDPELKWGTYVGHRNVEHYTSVKVDNSGNVFVVGWGGSVTGYPVIDPGGGAYVSGYVSFIGFDIIITKFSPGGAILWSTYYGGASNDYVQSLAIMKNQDIILTGYTLSTNLPTHDPGGGAFYQGTNVKANPNVHEVFLLKFSNGGVRKWATYFGSDKSEDGYSLVADPVDGTVYVLGDAGTTSPNIPLKDQGGNAYYDDTHAGGDDMFLAKFSASSALLWSTFIGGSNHDQGRSLAIDNNRNIYVTGQTTSSDFPLKDQGGGAYFDNVIGNNGSLNTDIVFLKFSQTGEWLWSSFYGGHTFDRPRSIATDNNGNVIIVGETLSDDFPLFDPGNGAFFSPPDPSVNDAFVKDELFLLKFSNTGVRQWATCFGGDSHDRMEEDTEHEVLTDNNGNIFISGETHSSDLPTFDPGNGAFFFDTKIGTQNGFLARFSSSNQQTWGTYHGSGTGGDNGAAIAMDNNTECLYAVGYWTKANTRGLLDPGGTFYYNGNFNAGENNGAGDAYIMKFCPTPCPPAFVTASATTICSGENVTLTASGGGTYLWSTGSTQAVITESPNATATYMVTISNTGGCESINSIEITVNPSPTAEIRINGTTSPFVRCEGSVSFLVMASEPNCGTCSYTWDNGLPSNQTVFPPVPSSPGTHTYNVTVTSADNCKSYDSNDIVINPLPVLAPPSVVHPCDGQNNGSITVNVQSGQTPLTYSVGSVSGSSKTVGGLSAKQWSYGVTDANGCSANALVTLSEIPLPTVTTSNDTSICAGDDVTISAMGSGGAGGPYSYAWDNGLNNSSSHQITPPSTKTYHVTVTDDASNCENTGEIEITVNPVPVANAGNDETICEGTNTTLQGSVSGGVPNYIYTWSHGLGQGQSHSVSPPFPMRTYTLTVTDGNGCEDTDTKKVTVNASPLANAGNDETICEGTNTTLQGSVSGGVPNYTYTWSHGLGQGQSHPVSPPAPMRTYTLTVTDGNGCEDTDTKKVTVNALPLANAGNDETICEGTNTTLQGSVSGGVPNYTYTWSHGLGQGQSHPVSPPAPMRTYTLTVTDGNGCKDTDTKKVTVNALPLANAGNDETICEGTNTTLQGSVSGGVPNYTYTWSHGLGQGQSHPVSPPAPMRTYTLTVTDGNGCEDTDTKKVTVNASPLANAGNDETICEGTNTTLQGSVSGGVPSYTYTWSHGLGQGQSHPVSPPAPMRTYTLTVTDGNGCEDTDTKKVTVNALPLANAGNDETICEGTNTTLQGSVSGGVPNYTYTWSHGLGQGQSHSVSPPSPMRTYTLTVTDGNGCEDTDTKKVTVNASPLANAGNDETICEGTNTTLQGSVSGGVPNYTYTWSHGLGQGQSHSVSPPSPMRTYTLTVTDGNGCEDTDTKKVTVNASPLANAGNDETICEGTNTTLQGSVSGGVPNYTYTWSHGLGQGQSHSVSPPFPMRTYTLTVTDGNGCEDTDTKKVTVNALPLANAGNDETICEGTSITLQGSVTGGSPNYTYTWSHGLGQGQSHPVSPPFPMRTYTLTVTDGNGCEDTDTKKVTVNAAPLANAGNDTTICAGASITLQGSVSGGIPNYTYTWSHGLGQGQSHPVNPPFPMRTYTLTVTDGNGCEDTDTKKVTVNASPVANAGNDTAICAGTSITLQGSVTGGSPNYTYTWTHGLGQGQSHPVSPPFPMRTYTLTVTDGNGCEDTDTKTVTVNTLPLANAGNDTTICEGMNITLQGSVTGGTPNYTYTWSHGLGQGQSHPVSPPFPMRTYTLTVTDGNGCEDTDTKTVTVNALPVANAGNDTTICEGANVVLQGSVSGGIPSFTYNWNNGAGTGSSPIVDPTTTTTYTLTVTDGNGCLDTNKITVTVSTPELDSIVDITTILCQGDTTAAFQIYASSGILPFQFSIDTGHTFQLSDTFNLLPADTFNIVIEDAIGCRSDTTTKIIVEPGPLSYSVTTVDATCGNNDGKVIINASGGVGNYVYSIDSGDNFITVNTIDTLLSGTYDVAVKDSHDCIRRSVETIADQNGPSIDSVTATTLVCNGDSNGILTAYGQGGHGMLTYSIDNGVNFQSSPVFTGLKSGNYDVVVADTNGCISATVIDSITEPEEITYLVNVIDATCGNSDGSLEFTNVTGGAGGYNYSIDSGDTYTMNVNFSLLVSGTYHVAVKDSANCISGSMAWIADIDGPTIDSVIGGTLLCKGDSDGVLVVYAQGGTGSLSYSIDNGLNFQPSDTFTGLKVGNYNILVKDVNDCISTMAMGIVTEPSEVTFTVQTIDATCGDPSGTLSIIDTKGGVGAYSYSTDSGNNYFSDSNFVSLASGNYDIAVVDDNGCVIRSTTSIANQSGPTLDSIEVTHLLCNGDSNGVLVVHAQGGTGTLTYSVDSGATFQASDTFTGLKAGNYPTLVKDSKDCITPTQLVNITEPADITYLTSTTDATCGNPTGSLTITSIAGGVGSYSYSIDSGNNYGQDSSFMLLSFGSYNVAVIDSNGCEERSIASVSNQSGPTIDTIIATSLLCNGDSNGMLIVNALGGTGTLSYSHDSGLTFQLDDTLTGLKAGNYDVLVMDSNGCLSSAVVASVNEPDKISYQTNVLDATCGNPDGSITITNVSGGAGNYSYSIDSGITFLSDTVFSFLSSGIYDAVVQDDNGCIEQSMVSIGNQSGPIIDSITATPLLCHGDSDGVLVVYAQGGTGSLTYSADNGSTFQPSSTFSNLKSGDYNILVTDSNGCNAAIVLASISEPSTITYSVNVKDAACGDPTGSLWVTNVSGGVGDYSYSIDSGNNYVADSSFMLLVSDTYFVAVKDGNGCEVRSTSFVGDQSGPTIDSVISTDLLCNGDSSGMLKVYAQGGTGLLTYSIDNGASFHATDTFQGLIADSYNVVAKDSNGCLSLPFVKSIGEPSELTFSVTTSLSTCGNADGAITIAASGGVGSYSYSIDNGNTYVDTLTFTGLFSGNYTVVVRDSNNCEVNGVEHLGSLDGPMIDSITTTDVLCVGGNTGTLTVYASGGSGNLSYSYDTGNSYQSSDTFVNLEADTYHIVVIDTNGCSSDTLIATVEEPDTLALTLTAQSTTCSFSNGTITAMATGGVSPYNYSIDGGSSYHVSPMFINLMANTYGVIVRDANGCMVSEDVSVIDLPGPTIDSLTLTDALCNGDSTGTVTVHASGGNGNLLYSNDDGITFQVSSLFSDLSAGNYSVIVSDTNNCSDTSGYTITEPTPLEVNASVDEARCDMSNGAISVIASGGVGTYSFSWSNNGTTNHIDSLSTGTYVLTVTDGNGCILTQSYTINQLGNISVAVEIQDRIIINGHCDGVINATATTNYPPVSYAWSPSNNLGATATSLCAGQHCVTAIDSLGCIDSICITLLEPPPLTAISTFIDPLCFKSCDGSINVSVGGGIQPYTFNWDNGATDQHLNSLCEGTYVVTITDSGGAFFIDTTTLFHPDSLEGAITFTHPGCNLKCDGNANALVSGGTSPYSYNWGHGSTSQNLGQLCSGMYAVSVMDAHGCIDTASVTLVNVGDIFLSATGVTDASCFGYRDGNATLVVTSGVSPYTYNWDNGLTVSSTSTLSSGEYKITATDNKGCFDTTTINIGEPTKLTLAHSEDTNICYGGTATLKATASGSHGDYDYFWDLNTVGDTFSVSPTTLTCYSLHATDSVGCSSDTTNICVSVIAPISVTLTASENKVCDGDSTLLTSHVTGGIGNYEYTWLDTIFQGDTLQVTPEGYPLPQLYWVRVDDGCSSPGYDTLEIGFHQKPSGDFSSLLTEGCDDLLTTFVYRSSGLNQSCRWDFGDGDVQEYCGPVSHFYEGEGDYDVTLTITTIHGCIESFVQGGLVRVYSSPEVSFEPDPSLTTIYDPDVTFVTKSDAEIGVWNWCIFDTTTGVLVDTVEGFDPTYSFDSPEGGVYEVVLKGTTPDGCSSNDTQLVTVLSDPVIFIPSGFSPDLDGENDIFFVRGIGITEIEIVIYERWGHIVYKSEDIDMGWDGSHWRTGKRLNPAVFTYVVSASFVDGSSTVKKGNLTLIRNNEN